MSPEFISEKIEIKLSEDNPSEPVGFKWRGKEYQIQKIINQWQDFSFGGSPTPKRAAFRQRRHRNYYRVRTTTNDLFDLYYDRGVKTPVWILAQKLDSHATK